MSANQFPNQFNIALNQQAAKIVLNRSEEFAEFTVVPSHAAQSTKYQALALKKHGGRCLDRWTLGFNCREDPVKVVTEQVSLEQHYADKAYSMPDLTSFSCALAPDQLGPKLGYVEVEEQEGGTLLFQRSDKGIRMLELDDDKGSQEKKICALFAPLIL